MPARAAPQAGRDSAGPHQACTRLKMPSNVEAHGHISLPHHLLHTKVTLLYLLHCKGQDGSTRRSSVFSPQLKPRSVGCLRGAWRGPGWPARCHSHSQTRSHLSVTSSKATLQQEQPRLGSNVGSSSAQLLGPRSRHGCFLCMGQQKRRWGWLPPAQAHPCPSWSPPHPP